ncbi:hypothetical protein TNCV_3603361 [Trichonephila clavipes]|nr:hypothetical protein TNCV_3603361 [Trichonephila clavipes]
MKLRLNVCLVSQPDLQLEFHSKTFLVAAVAEGYRYWIVAWLVELEPSTTKDPPCRFVEWAQNEIAVVPDFHKRILFSDEAHFWLNGYVNKQNCRIWSEANPQVYVETPLLPEKLTFWGYVKSLVYADKPQTLDHLEDNIRRVIADIRPQMLEKVIENWTSRLDYIRASRGRHMPEIIFEM